MKYGGGDSPGADLVFWLVRRECEYGYGYEFDVDVDSGCGCRDCRGLDLWTEAWIVVYLFSSRYGSWMPGHGDGWDGGKRGGYVYVWENGGRWWDVGAILIWIAMLTWRECMMET